MSAFLAFRLVKFLGIALLGAGVFGAAFSSQQSDRLRAAHVLAPLGWFVTMLAGYLVMKALGQSMSEPFISRTLWSSLLATGGAMWAAHRPGRLGAALAVAGLALSVGFMVVRTSATPGLVAAAIAGGAAAAWVPTVARVDDRVEQTRRWFKHIARLEGASLVFMLLISMPLRKLAGIALDGGDGWIGWIHGVLVLLFVQALVVAWRVLGWGFGRVVLAFVASLIPFGTFVFEWRYLKEPSTTTVS